MNFVTRAVLGLSFGLGFISCASLARRVIEPPKVSLAQVSIKDFAVDGATLLIGLKIDNPNPFTLRVDALKYDVDIGGSRLASSELPGAASVPGHGSNVIEIPLPVKFERLFTSALDIFSKGTSGYRIKGEARFGLLTVPFDKTGELKLR